jgi:hypothetical protein
MSQGACRARRVEVGRIGRSNGASSAKIARGEHRPERAQAPSNVRIWRIERSVLRSDDT